MIFKIHSHYFKYHYNDRIQILVVKCTNCSKYHAIIPSFSLPGTSLGTAETEEFSKNRASGQTWSKAGKRLLDAGISFRHLKYIEKMLHRAMKRMTAFFEDTMPSYADDFIYSLNTFCLERGVNAVFCNRVNILQFQKTRAGSIVSNNLSPAPGPGMGIDSS